MAETIPAFVSRKRAAAELDMSVDTFDNYVRKSVLPAPKQRAGITRWKWTEIEGALDGGNLSIVQCVEDDYIQRVGRAKATND
jgi:hypothetical protein